MSTRDHGFDAIGCSPKAERWVCCAAVFAVFAVALLCFSTSALAVFTRPFVREIARASNPDAMACTSAERAQPSSSCLNLATEEGGGGGVAVDAKDDLWVGGSATVLDEFEPAYPPGESTALPLNSLSVSTIPGSVAIESATTGDCYVANPNGSSSIEVFAKCTGMPVKSWGSFQEPQIAIDNSTHPMEDPSACETSPLSSGECIVYVTQEEGGAIEKFNSKGIGEPFSAAGLEYVSGNKITGIPGEPHPFGGEAIRGLAIDSKGDIYAVNGARQAIYEYAPSGAYVRTFEFADLGSNLVLGAPDGVAVDPLSGRLLVSVSTTVAGSSGHFLGAVDEFESTTGRFVRQVSEAGEGVPMERPVGLAFDSIGDLYVVDQKRNVVDVFGPGRYPPTPTLGEPSERRAEGANRDSVMLTGSVNPAQDENSTRTGHLEVCYFQYTTEAEFDESVETHGGKASEGFSGPGSERVECAPPADTISTATEAPQLVRAPIKGLKAGVTYRYRLLAASGGPLGGSEATAALSFTAPAAPRIESTSAQSVSSAFAELHASIDPLGADTTYYFEYGQTPAYGSDAPVLTVAAPYGVQIGAGGPTGSAVQSVVQRLAGLAPDTAYHFRVVARNEIKEDGTTAFGPETSYGPDQTFATLPEAQVGLPDGRSYELVTPAQKEGGSDMFAAPEINGQFYNTSVGMPSESGEDFLLETNSPFGEFPFGIEGAYVFRRDPTQGKWSYTSLASRSLGVQSFVGALFDPFDFSRVAINDGLGTRVEPEGERIADLVGPAGAPGLCSGGATLESAVSDDCYIELHEDLVPFHENTDEGADTQIVGASNDLTHLVLASEPIAGEAEPCPGAAGVQHGEALCEWSGGALRLVNVKPGSESDQPVSACGAVIGDPFVRKTGSAYRAVSADGSRVFFTAPDPGTVAGQQERLSGFPSCWNGEVKEKTEGPKNAPQLYVGMESREDPGEYETLDVSAPEKSVRESGGKPREYPAEYVGASEDGADVFFVTETWLTQNHPAGHDKELYECEITEGEGGVGCKLTRISIPVGGAGAPGDLFTVLAVSAEGEGSSKGQGSVAYFTTNGVLASNANSLGETASPGNCAPPHNGFCPLYRYQPATASAAASTTFIAMFRASTASHTGEDGDPLTPEPKITQAYTTTDGRYLLFENDGGEEEDGQIYRYDSATDVLMFVADGGFTRSAFGAGDTESLAAGPVHAMSEDGEFVFFDSTDRLVTTASNQAGPTPTLDTYEWHDGRVSLIGSGSDPGPTYFLGYSPYYIGERKIEGGNVFVGTHAQLSPQDTNALGNIYDARICEPESPCIQPPEGETAQCLGGTCQTPPGAPADPTATLLPPAASSTPNVGASNTKPLTRAQKLAAALKVCRKDKKKKKRAACEKEARRHYGPAKKAKRSAKSNRKGRR
jgi:hypothetical protein